jgi:hypothetical protein
MKICVFGITYNDGVTPYASLYGTWSKAKDYQANLPIIVETFNKGKIRNYCGWVIESDYTTKTSKCTILDENFKEPPQVTELNPEAKRTPKRKSAVKFNYHHLPE